MTTTRIDGATFVQSNPELAPSPSGGEALDNGFSPDQLKIIAEDGIRLGRWDRAQANVMLAEQGVKPEGPDTRTDAQKEMDEGGFAPARPEEYRLPRHIADERAYVSMTPEERKFDADARNWLSAAGFPRTHGGEFVRFVLEDQKTLADQDSVTRELTKRTTIARLKERWGGDFDQNLSAVHEVMTDVERKRPGFIDWMERTGAGNSERVVVSIFQQATRNRIRDGR